MAEELDEREDERSFSMLVRRYQSAMLLLCLLSSLACATTPQELDQSNVEPEDQAQELIRLELTHGGLDAFIDHSTRPLTAE